jgi:hypothetical protein
MAAAGILATCLIVGVTVGVLLSNQCRYYYVNGVCYRYQRQVDASQCNSTILGCCYSTDAIYIYDGYNGFCYAL